MLAVEGSPEIRVYRIISAASSCPAECRANGCVRVEQHWLEALTVYSSSSNLQKPVRYVVWIASCFPWCCRSAWTPFQQDHKVSGNGSVSSCVWWEGGGCWGYVVWVYLAPSCWEQAGAESKACAFRPWGCLAPQLFCRAEQQSELWLLQPRALGDQRDHGPSSEWASSAKPLPVSGPAAAGVSQLLKCGRKWFNYV